MHIRAAATSGALLSILALGAGCDGRSNGPARPQKSQTEKFVLLLGHFGHGVTTLPDLMIVEGSYPARTDPHVAVEVTPEQVEAIMTALNNCRAMTRQDGAPPGVPLAGWRLELDLTRKDGEKVQGYWHLGREVDINLPGGKRDILQAARESLAGPAREAVDRYFADVGKRAGEVANAVKAATAPMKEFVAASVEVQLDMSFPP